MDKVILVEISVRNFLKGSKVKAAQDRINQYIRERNLDVLSVSLLKNDDDDYIFTITTR